MISGTVVFVLGASVILAAAALGTSLFSLWRSQMLLVAADERARAGVDECAGTIDSLRKQLGDLTKQLRDIPQEPHSRPTAGKPPSGLNLTKRTQVLRLYRSGEPSDRIASMLDLPRQEVDLLIKVNGIVIKSI